jgi:citrate lyase subunit beta/citryl-CoA lyase
VTIPLRSLLFVPGTRRDLFAKATASGADAVVFDLEDSIRPTNKVQARHAIAEFMSGSPRSGCSWLVRINAFGTPWIADDLEFIGRHSLIDAVVLPKTESPGQVEEVARAVLSRTVIPLLETARGILNALATVDADAVIPAVSFGAEDLTAQLGVPRTIEGLELLFARSQVVLAAAAVGADAIDTVFTNLSDAELLQQDALRARALGFRGKMTIHPKQIEVINKIFSPSSAEVDRAQRLVDAYEMAAAQGQGAIRWEDQMIDAPVVLRARRILMLAEMLRISETSRPRS